MNITRRAFLTATTASIATFSVNAQNNTDTKISGKAPARAEVVPGSKSPNEKLNIASIGVGGEGFWDIDACKSQNIVALCDVDWHRAARAFHEYPKAKRFRDFRNMFDKIGKEIDAVTITIPDHMHALAAYTAMQHGKHVYVQKPLTHTIAEARLLLNTAHETGVITQMGNQGHSGNGMRELCEMLWSGAIGKVREAHVWTNRPTWPGHGTSEPLPPEIAPELLDWDRWIGVANWRPYNKGYVPRYWRAWQEFGSGAMGDMACHIMDPVYTSLRLIEAPYFSVEVIHAVGLNNQTYPSETTIKYSFPARGDMPPVDVYWYDGYHVEPKTGKKIHNVPKRPADIPPDQIIGDLEEQGKNGSLLIGENGYLTAGTYGGKARLLPDERMAQYTMPPQILERIPDEDHHINWIMACKTGEQACSNFDYAVPFTEMIQLGNLAIKTGKKLRWDNKKGTITNIRHAERIMTAHYRKGWELPV